MMKILSKIVLATLLLAGHAFGTTTAASASSTDVLAAYNAEPEGGTVIIPAGDVTWTATSPIIAVTKSITFRGTGYSNNGTPSDLTDDTWGTIIRNGITTGTGRFLFTTSGPAKVFRFEEIEFRANGVTADGSVPGWIQTGGSSGTYTVFERCKSVTGDYDFIVSYGKTIAAKCYHSGNLGRFIRGLDGAAWGTPGQSNGDGPWNVAADWGSANFNFIEDCYITCTTNYAMFDGWNGGKLVARYNNFVGTGLGNHGTESSSRLRSMRAMEIYRNTFSNPTGKTLDSYLDIRGGNVYFHDNTITFTGADVLDIRINCYRMNTRFDPWGEVDGTKDWDTANTSDTGTGDDNTSAGDGIFSRGTITTGASGSITDSGKSWAGSWANYSCRVIATFTASSGSGSSVTVTGAGWTTNKWTGWNITRVADGKKGVVSATSTDTLTLSTGSYRPTFTAGDVFIVSRATGISSSTATSLNLRSDFHGNAFNMTGREGLTYEIRKTLTAMDNTGRGASSIPSGNTPSHVGFTQALEPSYFWNNTDNGGAIEVSNASYGSVVLDRDYYLSAPSGYTEYTYPHPLRSDATAPAIVTVAVNNTTLSLTFNKSVTGVSAADFALSSGTLSAATGSGTTWSMTVSPTTTYGTTYTLNYTAGGVTDGSTPMASFSGLVVTNSNVEPSVRNPGRSNVKKGLF